MGVTAAMHDYNDNDSVLPEPVGNSEGNRRISTRRLGQYTVQRVPRVLCGYSDATLPPGVNVRPLYPAG